MEDACIGKVSVYIWCLPLVLQTVVVGGGMETVFPMYFHGFDSVRASSVLQFLQSLLSVCREWAAEADSPIREKQNFLAYSIKWKTIGR